MSAQGETSYEEIQELLAELEPAQELLADLEAALQKLKENPEDIELVGCVFRAIDNLKSGAE